MTYHRIIQWKPEAYYNIKKSRFIPRQEDQERSQVKKKAIGQPVPGEDRVTRPNRVVFGPPSFKARTAEQLTVHAGRRTASTHHLCRRKGDRGRKERRLKLEEKDRQFRSSGSTGLVVERPPTIPLSSFLPCPPPFPCPPRPRV